MNELCPMCKKHPAIIMTENDVTMYKGVIVEYDETFYFCSTLGKGDENAYFIPPKVMDENLRRIREAYERKMKQ